MQKYVYPVPEAVPAGQARAGTSIVTKAFRDGPYALRATLASEMLRNNTSLPVISETLSHSCADTTKVYLKVDFEHLRLLSMDVPQLDVYGWEVLFYDALSRTIFRSSFRFCDFKT